MSVAEVVKGIHDVTIVTSNVAELRTFYGRLGFRQVVDRGDTLAVFLSAPRLNSRDSCRQFPTVLSTYMVKRLQSVGNSSGIIIDKPILELLRITPETELDISTDGERLIITPLRSEATRKRKLARAQERTMAAHERTFRKLAK